MSSLVDCFVDGNIAIRVMNTVSDDDLILLENAINESAGYRIGETSTYNGFVEYCHRQLCHVFQKRSGIDGIEVAHMRDDNRTFGYMPIGTRWYQDHGLEVLPIEAFVCDIRAETDPVFTQNDFEAVFT